MISGPVHTTQPGWAFSERRDQWELFDTRGQVHGWITAEMIVRVDAGMLAHHVQRKMGSVPPPLEPHLPRPRWRQL